MVFSACLKYRKNISMNKTSSLYPLILCVASFKKRFSRLILQPKIADLWLPTVFFHSLVVIGNR
uniref:Uncharacterized protein n=1 Tax=Ascaris lumbricoides TaxID=6252 RepID=A0A0M3IUN9_ASCLU